MSDAQTKFDKQISLVDQLITIHRKLQNGPGRRHEQDALHKAGVVLTVAAWQAYVENLLREGLDVISAALSDTAPTWTLQAFKIRRSQIEELVKKFNTPDDAKVRKLFLDTLGFDPCPAWEWKKSGRNWDAKEVQKKTNDWLQVRHSIAHGADLPDNVQFLKGKNGKARLTLELLEECRKHFQHIIGKTDIAFSNHLVNEFRVAKPW